jgi:hypothetical protein
MPLVSNSGLNKLRAAHPWPSSKPNLPFDGHGWLAQRTAKAIRLLLTLQTPSVILELGVWLGKSSRYFCDHTKNCHVIGIDNWVGVDKQKSPRTGDLQQQYYANCWDYRNRITVVRSDTVAGMRLVHSFGVVPQLIYVDAAHDYKSVSADINEAIKLFPQAVLVGDDYGLQGGGVPRAVKEAEEQYNRESVVIAGWSWIMIPGMTVTESDNWDLRGKTTGKVRVKENRK